MIPGIIPSGRDPVAFIAEVGNAHNGDFARAIRLLDAMRDAGATAAKLQCYTADELVVLRGNGPAPAQWGEQGWSMRDLYEHAATPFAWFPRLYDHARAIGLPIFSSVFGPDSLALLESLDNPVFKIAKFERKAESLCEAVAKTSKPMIVSVPELFDFEPVAANVYQLYCPGSYPCAIEDVHLPREFAPHYLGLSSHCLAPELPVAAVARGAKVIEMHVQLADEPSALEGNISLTEHQVRSLIASLRVTESLLRERAE